MKFIAIITIALALVGCTTTQPQYDSRRVQYSEEGEVIEAMTESQGQVISELRRQFDTQTLTGEGRIENSNEGLARRAATQLAVGELAGKVETQVRGNTRIYNNSDVRDVLETKVAALVQNYQIDSAGYSEDGRTYIVQVSLSGQRLVEEFRRNLR